MRPRQQRTKISLAVLAVCGLMTSAHADATSPGGATLSYKSKQDLALITTEIKSGNDTQISQALTQIKAWIDDDRVQAQLYHDWIPALVNDQRYQDAADLALAGALARPEIRFVTPLMLLRTRALLALGDADQALAAAKGYYNVCYMKNTSNAIQLVAECFAEDHLEDGGIAQRFINEQSVASGGMTGAHATQPATPMLKTVQVDQSLYADALNKWKARTVLTGDFNDFASYADVLLIADKPAEAQKIFMTLYQQASTEDELNTAIEGIARSMRAEDGNIGRANAWLLSLQKTGNQPTGGSASAAPVANNPTP